jgi:hypothetical protein
MTTSGIGNAVVERDSVVTRDRGVRSFDTGGGVALRNPSLGTYYRLSETGLYMWRMTRRPTSAAVIREALVQAYEIPAAECERLVLGFLQRLADEGLVQVTNTARPDLTDVLLALESKVLALCREITARQGSAPATAAERLPWVDPSLRKSALPIGDEPAPARERERRDSRSAAHVRKTPRRINVCTSVRRPALPRIAGAPRARPATPGPVRAAGSRTGPQRPATTVRWTRLPRRSRR